MTLREKIKIECIKKKISITDLTSVLGYSHRQNLYYHIDKNNGKVLEEIEKALELEKGTFSR